MTGSAHRRRVVVASVQAAIACVLLAITGKARAVYAETIGNAKLDVPDFDALARIRSPSRR